MMTRARAASVTSDSPLPPACHADTKKFVPCDVTRGGTKTQREFLEAPAQGNPNAGLLRVGGNLPRDRLPRIAEFVAGGTPI